MPPIEATFLIFLQWAGYLLVLAIALHLVAHYAKSVIEHHHKIKAAMTLMTEEGRAHGADGLAAFATELRAAKERASNGVKR